MNVLDLKKKPYFRIFFSLLVLAVIVFLGRGFLQNWRKISIHELHFNYWLLVLSLVGFIFQTLFAALAWRKIILLLQPHKTISRFLAIRIQVFSLFGKYLPGISWAPAAKLYFGKQQEFSGQKLAISVVYENLLSVIAGFILSLFLLGKLLHGPLFNFYFITIIAIVIGLIITHPRVFYRLTGFTTKLFKRTDIPKEEFLKTIDLVKVIFYHIFAFVSGGLGLYFLINSLFYLPILTLPVVISGYALAIVFGVVVLFAPAGIGVREGVLVAMLSSYFSLESAIFISVIARIWTTTAEIVLFLVVWSYNKLKKL